MSILDKIKDVRSKALLGGFVHVLSGKLYNLVQGCPRLPEEKDVVILLIPDKGDTDVKIVARTHETHLNRICKEYKASELAGMLQGKMSDAGIDLEGMVQKNMPDDMLPEQNNTDHE